jgi:uncharacterized protein YfbU (UPF0304 family)
MTEYVTRIQSLKTITDQSKIIAVLDKANAYKYNLVEMLGETEFINQLKDYTTKYNRLGFLI